MSSLVSGYLPALGIGVGVLCVVAYYRLFKTRRTLAPRPAGVAVARWTGSCKTSFVTRAWTAQLEFFEWGIRVSGLWPWSLILPIFEFRYHELLNVQRVKWWLTEGVLLRTDGPAAPLVFITTRASQILVQFAMRGVSVEQEVAGLTRADLQH
jgi:hypothetical protein